MILDYSQFVELVCEEENGVYSSFPSEADVQRSAHRFIDPSQIPKDPFNVSREDDTRVMNLLQEYWRTRLELFGPWQYPARCPSCDSELISFREDEQFVLPEFTGIYISHCLNCGWWESDEELPTNEQGGRSIHRRAVLREFSLGGSQVPVETLRRYLHSHPDYLPFVIPQN